MRLFTAIGIGDEAHRALSAAQEALRARAEFRRWQPLAQLHLTLNFLGEVPEGRLPALHEAVAAAARASGPFTLALGQLGAFPGPRRPRVLWAGVEGDLAPLVALQADLAERFQALGLVLEARRYAPHLTLAREPIGPVDLAALASAVPIAPVPWRVEAVTLFHSQLRPEGAIHTALVQAGLGG
ncbi:MAG: RNA 2',3'-cyclic phosphodiesterase [Candidatus Sericytochromatia bacterium]